MQKGMRLPMNGKIRFSKYAGLSTGRYIRYRYMNKHAAGTALWKLARLVLLAGLTFIILQPLIIKLLSSLMSAQDLLDKTVQLVPRDATLDNYIKVIDVTGYWKAFLNNALVSLMSAVLQTLVAACVGYGLAKFKFKGRGIVFAAVIFTLIVPPHAILTSLYLKFRFFDILGILGIFGKSINLTENIGVMAVVSVTGLGLKNGLYMFIMRQFYRGVPDELIEAAYIDGSDVYRTFGSIMLPLSLPTMLTIFLLSFCWQWTDTFYSGIFFKSLPVLPGILNVLQAVKTSIVVAFAGDYSFSIFLNTGVLLIIAPLVLIYVFAQRFFVQGIERSGITG